MSALTADQIRAVLGLALAHCPEDLDEVLRLHRDAVGSLDGLSSAQLSGPDSVPASVDVAFERFQEAFDSLAADIADYAAVAPETLAVAR
jgi:hypothetical protein